MSKLSRARATIANMRAADREREARVLELGTEVGSAALAGGFFASMEVFGIPGFVNWGLGALSVIADLVPQKPNSIIHKLGGIGRGALYGQVAIEAYNRLGGSPFSAWAKLFSGWGEDS